MLAFIVYFYVTLLYGVAGRGLQLCKHATGLDTNCCGGGALTAVVLQPGQNRTLWTVDSVLRGVPLIVRQIDATPCSNSGAAAAATGAISAATTSAVNSVVVELDSEEHQQHHHKHHNGCCLS
jgi:hypothetical protein